jgi:hypothetical protein
LQHCGKANRQYVFLEKKGLTRATKNIAFELVLKRDRSAKSESRERGMVGLALSRTYYQAVFSLLNFELITKLLDCNANSILRHFFGSLGVE